jgi:hypothetical protein
VKPLLLFVLALAACSPLHDSLPGDSCEVRNDCFMWEICNNGRCEPKPDAAPMVDAGPMIDAEPMIDATTFDAGPMIDAGPVDAGSDASEGVIDAAI